MGRFKVPALTAVEEITFFGLLLSLSFLWEQENNAQASAIVHEVAAYMEACVADIW